MYEDILKELNDVMRGEGFDDVEAVVVSHLLLNKCLNRVAYKDEASEDLEGEDSEEEEDRELDEMEELLDEPEEDEVEEASEDELENVPEEAIPVFKKPKFVA